MTDYILGPEDYDASRRLVLALLVDFGQRFHKDKAETLSFLHKLGFMLSENQLDGFIKKSMTSSSMFFQSLTQLNKELERGEEATFKAIKELNTTLTVSAIMSMAEIDDREGVFQQVH